MVSGCSNAQTGQKNNFYFHYTETRYEKFKADKEEEQLDMQRNYKRKLSDADDKIR